MKNFKLNLFLVYIASFSSLSSTNQLYDHIPNSLISSSFILNYTITNLKPIKSHFYCLSKCESVSNCAIVLYDKDKFECSFYTLPFIDLAYKLIPANNTSVYLKKGKINNILTINVEFVFNLRVNIS
jgi:hypothetical protein